MAKLSSCVRERNFTIYYKLIEMYELLHQCIILSAYV